MSPVRQDAVRVGVIGAGAIGTVIADEIRAGRVARMTLAGVVAGRQTPRDEFHVLLETCDLIVEAASHAAVAEYGPAIKEAGVDLVVLSAGALVDDSLLGTLRASSGGRLFVSTGACGGIELLRAAHLVRPLDEVRLRTTKTSTALVRDWMEPEMRRNLSEGKESLIVFAGTAREAVKLFPETTNIAALLSLATVGFDATAVEIEADPKRARALHEVSARGEAGSYHFAIENAISEQNVRTSAVTAYSVLRGLSDMTTAFVPAW